MSRGRRAFLGFASDTLGQLLLTLAGFAMAPLILGHISAALYGFWLTALSILAYLGLIDAGLGLALTRAIAAHAGQVNDSRLNQLISSAFFAFCVAGLIFAGAGLSISAWIPDWFGIPAHDAPAVVRAFRVVVVASALALPCSVFSGITCGFQRMAIDNLTRTGVALAALLLSCVLLFLGWGLMALAASTLFSVLATAMLTGYWALQYHPGLQLRMHLVSRQELRALVSFGGYFQLGRVANTVALNSDSVVISSVLGAQSVTPYVFTSRLATLFSITLASKMPIASLPAMSQMYAARDFPRLQSALIRLSTLRRG